MKSHLSLAFLLNLSRNVRCEETPLRIIYEWPYVMAFTVHWKWCFGYYENIIMNIKFLCSLRSIQLVEKGHNLYLPYHYIFKYSSTPVSSTNKADHHYITEIFIYPLTHMISSDLSHPVHIRKQEQVRNVILIRFITYTTRTIYFNIPSLIAIRYVSFFPKIS